MVGRIYLSLYLLIKLTNKSMKARYLLGLFYPLFRLSRFFHNRGQVSALILHDIPDHQMDALYQRLEWLKKRYPFISPDDFNDFISGKKKLDGTHILITFDDGFASSAKAAREILHPLGIQALFFLTSKFLDSAEQSETTWRHFVAKHLYQGNISPDSVAPWQAPMSWSDARQLMVEGHGMAAHTATHVRLSELNDPLLLNEEMVVVNKRMETELGIVPNSMAYPFGDIGCIHGLGLASIAGHYRFGFSGVRGSIRGHPDQALILARQAVALKDPANYWGLMVENGLAPLYRRANKQLTQIRDESIKTTHP
jgi:peptidoglycan/xylan/chitin deacetylase (PgdA/CDA1 family)